jgi:hypothetical protein
MNYGVPVVATPVAIEGMHGQDGEDCLIAADPQQVASLSFFLSFLPFRICPSFLSSPKTCPLSFLARQWLTPSRNGSNWVRPNS